MSRYYLEKYFIAGYDMGEPYYCSCESGAYDNIYFDTMDEADAYAKTHEWQLDETEKFFIEFEGE